MSCKNSFEESESTKWFIATLQKRLNEVSRPLLMIALLRDDGSTSSLSSSRLFLVAAEVVKSLTSQKHVTVAQMTNSLKEASFLRFEPAHQQLAYQLVFILIGCVTMLFVPTLCPEETYFQIEGNPFHTPPYKGTSRPSNGIQISAGAQLSIVDLLKQLHNTTSGPIPMLKLGAPRSAEKTISLNSMNLSYYTLTRVAKVEIRWVRSLSMHLEFDRRKKVLSLFSDPSICALCCDHDARNSFMCR